MYPGASAKTVEDSVVQIIEQKMTGLDRLLYMSSSSDSAGMALVTLTFAPGTDPDLAWAKVQNKLQLALPMLPEVVQSTGLSVTKSTRNYLMILGLTSDAPNVSQEDLSDYLVTQVESVLARVPGVGEVQIFGTGLRHAHLARPGPPDEVRHDVERRHRCDHGRITQRSRRASSGALLRCPVRSSTRPSSSSRSS